MDFKSTIGQDSVKDYLIEAVENDRLPHAMLFLGSSGFGPLAMALSLAQYIMCEQKVGKDSCGVCSNCKKSAKLIHPDIHYTYPTIGTKMTSADLLKEWRQFIEQGVYQSSQEWFNLIGGENKQGNITKDECSRILKVLSLKTFEGQYKIHILWMAEFLGKQGNRLLKIIEEPPQNTIFILVAEDQDAILNTILSRCQIISFRPIDDDTIASSLLDRIQGMDPTLANQLAFLSDGDLGRALTLVDRADQLSANIWLDWLRLAYKGSGIELSMWVDKFNKMDKESQKGFMQYGLHFLREMLLAKLNENHQIRLPDNEKLALMKLLPLVTLDHIQQMIALIDANIFHLGRNANGRILMLDSSIQMHYLLRGADKQLEIIKSNVI